MTLPDIDIFLTSARLDLQEQIVRDTERSDGGSNRCPRKLADKIVNATQRTERDAGCYPHDVATSSSCVHPSVLLARCGAAFVTAMLLTMIGPSGCGGASSDKCRLHPESCHGAAGALCADDYDCKGGLHCCTDNNNCGGGMCTFDCKDDYDCPGDMLCEHSMCFYACASDADCAPSMSCEHDQTVCEYP